MLYSSGSISAANPGANNGVGALWAPAARSIRIVSVEVVQAGAAGAVALGLIRTSARGTQTATQVGLALDPLAGASTVQNDSTWSAQPTYVGSTYMRRIDLNGIGQGIVWTFDMWDPLTVAAAAGIAVRVISGGVASQTHDVNWLWDEG